MIKLNCWLKLKREIKKNLEAKYVSLFVFIYSLNVVKLHYLPIGNYLNNMSGNAKLGLSYLIFFWQDLPVVTSTPTSNMKMLCYILHFILRYTFTIN